MAIAEEYMAYLDEQVEANEQQETFQIDNDSNADWACRKIAQAQARMDERKAFVQAEIERLAAWQEEQDARDQATIDYMTSLLQPYFATLQESGALGKRKSYKLPHGTLQVRKAGPKWRRDEAALLEWAKEQGLVRVKESPDWAGISKRLVPSGEYAGAAAVDAETGEVVPGVQLEEPGGDIFSVKVGE